MGNVLVVSASPADSLINLLKTGAGVQSVVQAVSGTEARRRIMQEDYDMMVVNAPLPDELGDTLCKDFFKKMLASPILMVRPEMVDELSARTAQDGVVVVAKPASKQALFQAMRLIRVTHQQLIELQKQNQKLTARVEELRMVGRAKCALIQYKGLTEQQAHRYIEKLAMDQRQTRIQVAKDVLDMFE